MRVAIGRKSHIAILFRGTVHLFKRDAWLSFAVTVNEFGGPGNPVISNGLRLHGWPRSDPDTYYNGIPGWWHGDYKDVAYVYVQELYKIWVELTK